MFKSFFMAGFECTTARNRYGHRLDQVSATQHDRFVYEDYKRLSAVGIRTIREGLRWPFIQQNTHFDFSSFDPFLNAAVRNNIEIIYDLFHFGYPDNVDIFSEYFAPQFADYCYEAARYIRRNVPGPYYFTPINDPSYFAWAGGEVGLFAPYRTHCGPMLKRALARAAIQGIEAIWQACPGARIVNADSLGRIVASYEHPEMQAAVDSYNKIAVYESWDMLFGRIHPELGGSPKHLDIIGINYSWTNQWQIDYPGIPLEDSDPRKLPFHELIEQVASRYRSDVLVTGTSHVEEMRVPWLLELTQEALTVLERDIPLRGDCLYPILAMPEWHDQNTWTQTGLWELRENEGILERIPYKPAFEVLEDLQLSIGGRLV